MSKSVWKFQIDPTAMTVSMPVGAKLLTAREQGEAICVWAEVDTEAQKENRSFEVYGTGRQMPDDPGAYVGTAMFYGGRLVFHVYEERITER